MPRADNMARLPCALLAALLAANAQADWAGFSRFDEVAELAVEPGAIRLELRLSERAAPKEAQAAAPGLEPPWLAGRVPGLLDADGKPLAGRFEFFRQAREADGTAYYEAAWNYAPPPRADALRIAPPPDGGEAGLVVLHQGVPLADLAPLQKPLALALDWADPWRSRFDDPALARRHAEPRSYVYVEPYEVRHEIVIRLAELRPWLGPALKDPRFVEDGEREGLKHAIGALLLARNPLLIEGRAASPQLDRVEFVRFDRGGISPVAEPGRLDARAALVGAVLTHLTEAPAQTVALRWELFGPDAAPRQVSLIQGKETFEGYMTPKQPEYAWSQEEALAPAEAEPAAWPAAQAAAPLAERATWPPALALALLCALPLSILLRQRHASAVIGLALAALSGVAFPPRLDVQAQDSGAAGLGEARAKALAQALLHNAYRAFQLREEGKIYDRLALSLDGDLLDETYLQQRRAALRQARGLGGEGKVDRVEILQSEPRRAGENWEIATAWMAHGSVAHWGHSHERHNLYRAKLTLRPAADGQWRIVGLEFLDGQRLAPGAGS